MACIVVGCKSHSSRKEYEREYLSFHRFPMDEKFKMKWRQIIPQGIHLNKHSRVCSKHFLQECFINNDDKKWRRLKPDAVPSLLIPTVPAMSVDESQATTNTRNILTNTRIRQIPTVVVAMEVDECQATTSTAHISTSDSRLREGSFLAPMVKIEYPTTSSTCCPELRKRVSQLERVLDKVKKVSKRRLLKINALRQQTRRIQQKNVSLYNRLTDLIEQENIGKDKLLMLDSVNLQIEDQTSD